MHTATLRDRKSVKTVVDEAKNKGLKVGFVPTMGALHDGHLSLIKQAQSENDIVICSIFVNPTQFNDATDLDKYPRTVEADIALLDSIGTTYAYTPTIDDIYPNGDELKEEINFGGLDLEMEGAFRPGHFQGVGQVVGILLDIVQPTHLYMGQKDFQQFSLINFMIKDQGRDTILRVVPIKRAEDGLALSSRNARLSAEIRAKAPIIHDTLQEINKYQNAMSIGELTGMAMGKLRAIKNFNPEYVIIADGYTLKPITDITKHDYVVVCTAVWAGDVRLIDNVIIKGGL